MKIRAILPVLFFLITACTNSSNQKIKVVNNQLIIENGGRKYTFKPQFTILFRDDDPKLAMRPGGIEHVKYNVASWITARGKESDLVSVKKDDSQVGDGFDDRILNGKAESRTPDVFKSGQQIKITASSIIEKKDTIFLKFPPNNMFNLEAYIVTNDIYPKLYYSFTAQEDGYYSIGYTGAPAFSQNDYEEIWQPMIWQEQRFPDKSYLTLSYRTPIPTTLVYDGINSIGVLAASEEIPFQPLPLKSNSQFGVALRNKDGEAQPMLFAPAMGGLGSKKKNGDKINFSMYFVTEQGNTNEVFETIARKLFGFKDYRKNEISTLNKVFENEVDYALSDYAWFIDSLKGCAYSTDVPGAVKNVSSLNPLELAIVTDNQKMFEERAYPLIEYMLSREKFLFCLDTAQKIQHPSRKMEGPIAPISELTSLYTVLGKKNDFLIQMAKEAYKSSKIRNLDVEQKGETWINAMHIYKATGEKSFLEKAIIGADEYIEQRLKKPQTAFEDPFAGDFFFWTSFTPRWIELFELYEITKDEKYLKEARYGARQYAMFTWMGPEIPDSQVVVNKGGEAPMYWYLKSKGHKQMYYPEEKIDAWLLSEIGLTPESSGTCTGHRAIFMANYAPWMLRIGFYAKDKFLEQIAKDAIIGRYRNFPGYHINTERTNAYMYEDYPLHTHKELSVNSMHYNHILPHITLLLDYLVTDVFVRSDGAIDFPSQYIEGYAYLQNKMYGALPGKFYGDTGVSLWMPRELLTTDQVELNYIAGRKDDNLYLAFTNQSNKDVNATIKLNRNMVSIIGREAEIQIWQDNKVVKREKFKDYEIPLVVKANGISSIKLSGINSMINFQKRLNFSGKSLKDQYKEIDLLDARAMLFNLGDYGLRLYVYSREDESKFKSVIFTYTTNSGEIKKLTDLNYPFEFTVPLEQKQNSISFSLTGITNDKKEVKSDLITLGK